MLSIFSTCCYALLYRFWEFTGPFLPSYADKPLIAAILGGLFVGIGAGLIVRRGGASGGDDALALIAIGFALPFSFSLRMEVLSEHTE